MKKQAPKKKSVKAQTNPVPVKTQQKVATADSKFKPSEHWKGMPEFNQEDLKPFSSLTVNFQTAEDLHKFSKLIGQALTAKTRSIWFPEVGEDKYMDKRYYDKEQLKKKK